MRRPERLILDRSGQGRIPNDYRVIGTEAEFLLTALRDDRQAVRGASLCGWAESFWRSRGWSYGEIRSPVADVLTACPGISEEQAQAVLSALGESVYSLQPPITALDLLKLAMPGGPWDDAPSPEHAAAWLIWLEEAAVEGYVEPLMWHQTAVWEAGSGFAQRRAYRVTDPVASARLIGSWIGIEPESGTEDFGVFPIDVPQRWQQRARDKWKRDVVSSGVTVFDTVPATSMPRRVKEIAADEVCSFCIHHPEALTASLITSLISFLPTERVQQLREILPPDPPGTPPHEPDGLSEWFVERYIPYREWQADKDDATATEVVSSAAADFAQWYLDYYPRALTGGAGNKHLAMRRSEALRTGFSDKVTLWIILDGLHFLDAKRLVSEIAEQAPKIGVDQVSTALAAIPTITKFGKPALVTGLPPAQAENAAVPDDTQMKLLAENADPQPVLRQAKKGVTYLWSQSEPDKTYHKLTDRSTIRDNVYGVLKSLARKIAQAAEAVPRELSLRIVLSTDHGRMLGSGNRNHAVPEGMDAEGRAAYGASGTSFDDSGLMMAENGAVILLHGGRYGLPCDCAIALDENAFVMSDGKGGSGQFSHGGLYPEEVVVPWIELSRALARPHVEGEIAGKARPTFDGKITLRMQNLSDESLVIERLIVIVGGKELHRIDLEGMVSPYSPAEIEVVLRGWPTHEQIRSGAAVVVLRMVSGTEVNVPVRMGLEAEQMYKQDTTLEDLV